MQVIKRNTQYCQNWLRARAYFGQEQIDMPTEIEEEEYSHFLERDRTIPWIQTPMVLSAFALTT